MSTESLSLLIKNSLIYVIPPGLNKFFPFSNGITSFQNYQERVKQKQEKNDFEFV